MNIIETSISERLRDLPHNNHPTRVVLHHAEATSCTVDDIDRWHRDRGWQGIGYHYFVRKDGSIYKGRPDYTIGAHCLHNNTNTIGICAEGKYMVENMPDVQKQAIIDLIKYLGIKDIKGHRELSPSDCPGSKYPLDEIRNAVINDRPSVNTQLSISSDSSIKNKIGYITGNDVRVRLDPNGKILGHVNKGDKVTLWSKEGDWYHCYSLYPGYNRCYIHADYVKIGGSPEVVPNSVLDMQKILNRIKITDGRGNVLSEDGIKGSRTTEAIKRLQAICGLTTDGIAGTNTQNAITSILERPLLKLGSTGIVVRYLQYRVRSTYDGIFGDNTKRLTIEWQRRNYLLQDGIVGIKTWGKLIR